MENPWILCFREFKNWLLKHASEQMESHSRNSGIGEGSNNENLLSCCHVFFLFMGLRWSNQPSSLSMKLCSHKFTQQLVVSTQLLQKGTLHAWQKSSSGGEFQKLEYIDSSWGQTLLSKQLFIAKPANVPPKDTSSLSFKESNLLWSCVA